jgi:hypothetical protein
MQCLDSSLPFHSPPFLFFGRMPTVWPHPKHCTTIMRKIEALCRCQVQNSRIAPPSGAIFTLCAASTIFMLRATVRCNIHALRHHQAQYSHFALPSGMIFTLCTAVRCNIHALRCRQAQYPCIASPSDAMSMHPTTVRCNIHPSHRHQARYPCTVPPSSTIFKHRATIRCKITALTLKYCTAIRRALCSWHSICLNGAPFAFWCPHLP